MTFIPSTELKLPFIVDSPIIYFIINFDKTLSRDKGYNIYNEYQHYIRLLSDYVNNATTSFHKEAKEHILNSDTKKLQDPSPAIWHSLTASRIIFIKLCIYALSKANKAKPEETTQLKHTISADFLDITNKIPIETQKNKCIMEVIDLIINLIEELKTNRKNNACAIYNLIVIYAELHKTYKKTFTNQIQRLLINFYTFRLEQELFYHTDDTRHLIKREQRAKEIQRSKHLKAFIYKHPKEANEVLAYLQEITPPQTLPPVPQTSDIPTGSPPVSPLKGEVLTERTQLGYCDKKT